MKYKVGDKVRIREDLEVGKWYGKNTFVGSMDGFRGMETTIKQLGCEGHFLEGCGYWRFTDEMISGLATEEKIVITNDGKTTTAKLYDGKKVIRSAKADCSPEDEFNFETGAKIAFDRLVDKVEKEEENEQFYNGVVVCASDEICGFTKGKFYTFSGGQCVDDAGIVRPTEAMEWKLKRLDEYRTEFGEVFIEIKEDNQC